MIRTAGDLFDTVTTFEYDEFNKYVKDLYDENRTTGNDFSEDRLNVTRLNIRRIQRLDKKAELKEDLKNELNGIKRHWTWYLILEGWCLDGGQIAPYINLMANSSPNIELKILLRDDNPEVIDNYQTNGTRSIPKLICLDSETGQEIGTWGPRPRDILEFIADFKSQFPDASSKEFKSTLQKKYIEDNGQAIQNDFVRIIREWQQL